MRYIKLTMNSYIILNLLTILTIVFNNHFVVTAQKQSTPQPLDGTTWQGETSFPLNEFDIVYVDFKYMFVSRNKVKVIFNYKVSGPEFISRWNPLTGKFEYVPVHNPLKKIIPGNEACTYSREGKSIQIQCNSQKQFVTATVKDHMMDGEINFKALGKSAKWLMRDSLEESTGPSKTVTEPPINPNNTVTSKDLLSALEGNSKTISSSLKLKTSTYKVTAVQSTVINGINLTENTTFKIKIESVDANGNVKARLYKGDSEGRLEGRVDENGQLQLEGVYTSSLFNQEWNFKLKATVDGDKLTNGKYRSTFMDSEVNGTFTGIVEETFEICRPPNYFLRRAQQLIERERE